MGKVQGNAIVNPRNYSKAMRQNNKDKTMKSSPAFAFYFGSESNPNRLYETILYDDGNLTCNCPGWTRRVWPNGGRSCRHTRMVAAGDGPSMAANWIKLADKYVIVGPDAAILPAPQPKSKQSTKADVNATAVVRSFRFDD